MKREYVVAGIIALVIGMAIPLAGELVRYVGSDSDGDIDARFEEAKESKSVDSELRELQRRAFQMQLEQMRLQASGQSGGNIPVSGYARPAPEDRERSLSDGRSR